NTPQRRRVQALEGFAQALTGSLLQGANVVQLTFCAVGEVGAAVTFCATRSSEDLQATPPLRGQVSVRTAMRAWRHSIERRHVLRKRIELCTRPSLGIAQRRVPGSLLEQLVRQETRASE